MEKDDTELGKQVYDKTCLHACMCFDTVPEINKAMSFLCVLLKRGVIRFNDESNKTVS